MIEPVDIHCHLLPYVDDGAENWDEACRLLELEAQQGIRTVCVTPHLRADMFETEQRDVDAQYLRLREAAARQFGVRLFLGREYFCDSAFLDRLHTEALCTLGGGNTLLLEFSGRYSFETIQERVRHVLQCGYQVLVAHVERYAALQEDVACVRALCEQGAMIQINAGSVLGREGFRQKSYCKKLMRANLVHVVASDAHGTEFRPPELGRCAAYLEKKMGFAYADAVTRQNPLQIIGG